MLLFLVLDYRHGFDALPVSRIKAFIQRNSFFLVRPIWLPLFCNSSCIAYIHPVYGVRIQTHDLLVVSRLDHCFRLPQIVYRMLLTCLKRLNRTKFITKLIIPDNLIVFHKIFINMFFLTTIKIRITQTERHVITKLKIHSCGLKAYYYY